MCVCVSCIIWGNSNNSNYSYNIICVMLYPLGSQIFFGKRTPSYCRILQYIAILNPNIFMLMRRYSPKCHRIQPEAMLLMYRSDIKSG